MNTSTTTESFGSRQTVDAALSGIERCSRRARAVLNGLASLARQDAALRLRLAMVLAWVKRQDPSVLGYSSFTAFCREHVGVGNSWMRDLVRLVESPLDLVKAAACRAIVPLRIAVKAPGNVAVQDQVEWLLNPTFSARPPTPLVRFQGDDMQVIHRARQLARLCIKRSASAREVDDYILRSFKERIPASTLLAIARERPERPALGQLDWAWCLRTAPAQALLGPWVEPSSVADAARQIRAINTLYQGRRAVLARTWAIADHYALWQLAGFGSGWDYALQVLGWSRRTAQRHRRVGWALEWYPELDRAIAQGLDLGSVALLAGVVQPSTVDRWVTIARRIGRLELIEAVRESRFDDATLERYERALAQVDRWAAGELGDRGERAVAAGSRDAALNAGGQPEEGEGAAAGSHRCAPTAGGPRANGEGAAAGSHRCAPTAAGQPENGEGAAAHAPSPALDAGGPPEECEGAASGWHRCAPTAGVPDHAGPIRVSLPRAVEPAPLVGRGPPGLAEAARWFVEHVRIAPQRGFARIKERDRYRCQNPECGRVSLRAEAHHIHPRSLGGSDDEHNGVTVCRACHLRGIHTADLRIQVERAVLPSGAKALVWRYAGGRIVVALR